MKVYDPQQVQQAIFDTLKDAIHDPAELAHAVGTLLTKIDTMTETCYSSGRLNVQGAIINALDLPFRTHR